MFYVIVTTVSIISTSAQLPQGYRTLQECQAEIVRNTPHIRRLDRNRWISVPFGTSAR